MLTRSDFDIVHYLVWIELIRGSELFLNLALINSAIKRIMSLRGLKKKDATV